MGLEDPVDRELRERGSSLLLGPRRQAPTLGFRV